MSPFLNVYIQLNMHTQTLSVFKKNLDFLYLLTGWNKLRQLILLPTDKDVCMTIEMGLER